MRLYHYTHAGHLPSIFAEGVLRTTDPNLDMLDHSVKPQVVWLTDQPVLLDEGMRDGLYHEKRQIRFTVEAPRAKRWLDWAPAKNMDPEWRSIMIKTGGGIEAAGHWYVSPRPIPRPDWVEIHDMWTDKVISGLSETGTLR